MQMKDLLYLQIFSPKISREARKMFCKKLTDEDLDRFLRKKFSLNIPRNYPKETGKDFLGN
jgi:hypothetical protein